MKKRSWTKSKKVGDAIMPALSKHFEDTFENECVRRIPGYTAKQYSFKGANKPRTEAAIPGSDKHTAAQEKKLSKKRGNDAEETQANKKGKLRTRDSFLKQN